MWMKNFISKLGSRKFLTTIFGAVAILSQQIFGVEIPKEVIENLISLIFAFLVIQGAIDGVSLFKKQ